MQLNDRGLAGIVYNDTGEVAWKHAVDARGIVESGRASWLGDGPEVPAAAVSVESVASSIPDSPRPVKRGRKPLTREV